MSNALVDPTLRQTTDADLAQVVAIEESEDTADWLGERGDAWHRSSLASPDQEHLVLVTNEVVVGYAVVAGLPASDSAVELRRIVIAPDARGAGHGRRLLSALLSRARHRHGARSVWLDVKPQNRRALDLYLREGFQQTPPPSGADRSLLYLRRVLEPTPVGPGRTDSDSPA